MGVGKYGVQFRFYAIAGFVLVALGYTTGLFLLVGVALFLERDTWTGRQVLQALFLALVQPLIHAVFDILSFMSTIPFARSIWTVFNSVLDSIMTLVVLIFCIVAVLNTARGKDAGVPGLSKLASLVYTGKSENE